jgi:hypothetical protein
VKRSRGDPKGKRQRGSSEPAQTPRKTTLAELLDCVDAAADEKDVSRIIDGLSPGTRAILYSALQYTQPPQDSADQPSNRSYALHILREFLL